jgi:hypothetical protein
MRTIHSIRFSILFVSVYFLILCVFAIKVRAQEPAMGDNAPPITILPADDSLTRLESEAELAEFREGSAQAEYDRLLSEPPRTAGERQQHLKAVKAARQKLFTAKADAHRTKAAWCQHYAAMVSDGARARLSAYKHRQLAGKWEQQALSMAVHERPTIEHSGRHRLDMSRYGD